MCTKLVKTIGECHHQKHRKERSPIKNNYHTHTWRCKHAQGTDEEYILAAIAGGFTAIGLSDHGPLPYTGGYSSPVRMDLPQLQEYFGSLAALKAKYHQNITIHIGFEYEYLPGYMPFIRELRKHPLVDYFLFGNHNDEDDRTGIFFGNAVSEAEIRRYEKSALTGMNTGLFSYMTHPDLFLSSYPHFDKAAKQVSRRICREAKALHMPLEYNLHGIIKMADGAKGIGYPSARFWEVAAEEGCSAIIGVDAHSPGALCDPAHYAKGVQALAALHMERVETLSFR